MGRRRHQLGEATSRSTMRPASTRMAVTATTAAAQRTMPQRAHPPFPPTRPAQSAWQLGAVAEVIVQLRRRHRYHHHCLHPRCHYRRRRLIRGDAETALAWTRFGVEVAGWPASHACRHGPRRCHHHGRHRERCRRRRLRLHSHWGSHLRCSALAWTPPAARDPLGPHHLRERRFTPAHHSELVATGRMVAGASRQ